MSFVIGRGDDLAAGPAARLGTYRALDGSSGAALHLDVDDPHAALIVGKRGYGKSYTMGAVAESLARVPGVAPVIVDPMGTFSGIAAAAEGDPVPAEVVESPAVAPSSLDPRSWCTMLDLSPESGPGSLLWQAAQAAETVDGMRDHVADADAPAADRRAATNHLQLASDWGVFDAGGLTARDLAGPEATVLDVSGLNDAAMNAVCRGVAETLYRARVTETIDRLPWLLVDEAHTFFDGVAKPAIETILTRGRAPGVSVVLATQRPSAISETGISQSDVLISHRLTSEADLEALTAAQPTYVNGSIGERMPTEPGEVVVIDDATETVHAAQVRSRATPHGGESPNASEVALEE